MKKFTLFFLVVVALMVAMPVFAQEMPMNLWQAEQTESRGCEYVANEVIVKFKHSSPVRIKRNEKTRRFISSNVTEVDMVLDSLGMMNIDDLMPLTGAQVSKKQLSVRGVRLAPDQNLSKLCNITFDTTKVKTVDDAIMMLERLPEVEYAEPNYIVRIMSSSASDTIYTHTDSATYTAEPLYSQQWGLSKINLPWLWKQPKSKKRPVIAILDTGVEIDHPDLAGNIWNNEAEINGVGGQDDDANGFFDDIHGYDFVNSTGVIGDRNGHGTHCAGIAAAVGNNGIGITGANPDALIMPIQVMDKSGKGNIATIIKGIDYANANGADILSMSIGSCGYSSAEEEALLKAFYNGKYLVAAAGNGSGDIYSSGVCESKHQFPGAFKFVIGVMATSQSGVKAGFSNYDSDGPHYSEFDPEGPAFFGDYYNYDISAPGQDIMSTFLGGTYREMSGTSMATPMLAGALSRLLQCRTFSSQENCQGLLIQTRDTVSYNNIDVKAAMEFDELAVDPVLVVTHYHIVDTMAGGNGDGLINPGETIEIYPTVQCIYGQANGISVRINQGLNVDTTTLEVIKNDARVGLNLSPGATFRCKEPIVAKFAERCGDGYTIQLYPTIHTDSMPTTPMASAYAHKLVLTVEDKMILGGVLDSILTLTSDKEVYVNSNFAMSENGVLNIMPGTTIYVNANMNLASGQVNAKGTPDSLINFICLGEIDLSGKDNMSKMQPKIEFARISSLPNIDLYRIIFENCIFESSFLDFHGSNLHFCNVNSNNAYFDCSGNSSWKCQIYNSNIVNNSFYSHNRYGCAWSNYSATPHNCNISENYDKEGNLIHAYLEFSSPQIIKLENPCWFGTYDEEDIREGIYDIYQNIGYAEADISNRLERPVKEAHGIVWKIHVNGEEILPHKTTSTPLGVGRHKFEVYYNRAMDVSVNPTVSFGVRKPYTQHVVAENPSWSADSTVFTAYYTIGSRTMTDGVNHVLVKGGRDNEKFPAIDETTRFDIIVQATGSLATGLFAEAGLGKVTLQWETDEEDFEDLMGYHIYRWTEDTIKWNRYYDSSCKCYIEAGWKFDTVVVNDVLLTPEEVEFVDYDVVPGKAYYYMIQQVTTSFAEYNFSNPVTATPLTATKGDANGSMTVDVADVVTEVTYLTGGNPQPFIFEAADVNGDGVVNILDVVGTVNIILNPSSAGIMSVDNTATYYIEDGILYVETPVALGGVQFTFVANHDAEIKPLAALDGFEKVSNWNNETEYMFMAYSMSGKTIPVGRHALLEIGDAELSGIVLSDTQGHNIMPINGTTTNLGVVEQMQLSSPYPNPFREQIVVPYLIGQTGEHAVRMVFTDVAGRTIDVYTTSNSFGSYSYTWTPAEGMLQGVYFVSLYVDNKLMQTSKIVYLQ